MFALVLVCGYKDNVKFIIKEKFFHNKITLCFLILIIPLFCITFADYYIETFLFLQKFKGCFNNLLVE